MSCNFVGFTCCDRLTTLLLLLLLLSSYAVSGVESGHAFGVPAVFENLVGFKALTIVLSYRNHIVMEVQYLVTLLLIHLLIFGQNRRYNATICQYCGKDFKSLGKHVWRCKSRVGNLSHDGQVSQGHAVNGSSSESSNTSGYAAEFKFKFSGNRL